MDPRQELPGGRRFEQTESGIAQSIKQIESGMEELVVVESRAQPATHDLLQAPPVGERNVVENTAPEKGLGEVLLRIAGQNEHRPQVGVGADLLVPQLRDPEVHVLDLIEQIVGEIAWGLVDLVDEYQRAPAAWM